MALRSSLDSPVTDLRRHLDPPITDLKSMTSMSEDHDLMEIQTEGPRRGTRRRWWRYRITHVSLGHISPTGCSGRGSGDSGGNLAVVVMDDGHRVLRD
jgi:hypothetical protein